MKTRVKLTILLLAAGSYAGIASAGLIHNGNGLFSLDSRDRTYMKITSTFGTISDFGIYSTNSWGAKQLYTLVPERTEILRNDVFYATMFYNTPKDVIYSWNGEQIIDYNFSNGDVFGFYMLTGGYHFTETDINFTDANTRFSEGILDLVHVNTRTNVTFSEHPYDGAFYPEQLPEEDPVDVSEPTSLLLFGAGMFLALRRKTR
ncbi:MAG: PEP-CTERM sorting domain-containing protein [Colwellia sp.]|nr:PEP-CTERM sorting domain-containing protein [Colwellia sp.]